MNTMKPYQFTRTIRVQLQKQLSRRIKSQEYTLAPLCGTKQKTR